MHGVNWVAGPASQGRGRWRPRLIGGEITVPLVPRCQACGNIEWGNYDACKQIRTWFSLYPHHRHDKTHRAESAKRLTFFVKHVPPARPGQTQEKETKTTLFKFATHSIKFSIGSLHHMEVNRTLRPDVHLFSPVPPQTTIPYTLYHPRT